MKLIQNGEPDGTIHLWKVGNDTYPCDDDAIKRFAKFLRKEMKKGKLFGTHVIVPHTVNLEIREEFKYKAL